MSAPFGISAEFPLGVYRATTPVPGAGKGGPVDPYPDTARLFSALVHAAHTGQEAVLIDGRLRPSEAAVQALHWFEQHPPDGITHPRSRSLRSREITGFFAEGLIVKEGQAKKVADKRRSGPLTPGVAVAGKFGWAWRNVPDAVQSTLQTLCDDVAYLGETESPVILRAEVLPETLRLSAGYKGFGHRGERARVQRIRSVRSGRLQALNDTHETTVPAKRPSLARDKHSVSTTAVSAAPWTDECTTEVAYELLTPEPPAAPWPEILVLSANGPFDPADSLAWCVALHRATAKYPGDLPTALTGWGRRDSGGATRSLANRVALQLFSPSGLPTRARISGEHCFLVMMPVGLEPPERTVILEALGNVRNLSIPGGASAAVRMTGEVISGVDFWLPPEEGRRRYWLPSPAMVPETRWQRDLQDWTLDHAAKLSLGFVFRDQLGPFSGRGARRYQDAVAAVDHHDVRVHATRLLTGRASRYVHKLPEGVVAQPYRAVLEGGSLVPEQALISAGQTRHLGGGLLLPLDLTEQQAVAHGLRDE